MAKTKIIITTIIATVCIGVFGGCSNNDIEETASESSDILTETEVTSDIPGAKEYDEIEWPSFGVVEKVPVPTWSNRGEILVDSELLHWSEVGYSTVDDFNDYVKACQEYGFTEHYYNKPGYMYYGENADGYAVQLTYNQYDHYVSIQITNNAAEWNKWWEE